MNATRRSPDASSSVALWVAAGLAVPADVDSRLRAGGTVLEVGCGGGLGCLALAEVYPSTRVVGHDRDPDAIERARSLAHAAALGERVSFEVTDSERLPRAAYDLATLQALSDRREASHVLNAVRNALVPGGVCLLVEPPLSFARGGSKRRVTVDNLRAVAERAGFSQFSLLCHASVDIYELRR